MATYRYLVGDLLTNTILAELPFFGVSFSRRLNKPGNCTASFLLGNSQFRDQDTIDATVPGRTAFWVERNGILVWGGILWSRTYQSQSNSLQFTGQTFESFFFKQFIEANFNKVTIDQRTILVDLVTAMQAKTGANIGILYPEAFGGTPVNRTVNFYPYQNWSFGKAIEYMINYSDGFDYTIEVGYDGSGNPTKTLTTDNKLGVSAAATQIAFDYPGNIKNYWYPESASNAAVSMLGFGAGEEALTLMSKVTISALLTAGYPDLQESYSNRDVSVQATLDSQTQTASTLAEVPMIVPTFETNPEMEPIFGSYSLGDYVNINIEDPRFPNGKIISTRIIGYDAKPTSAETQEEVKLVTSGEE